MSFSKKYLSIGAALFFSCTNDYKPENIRIDLNDMAQRSFERGKDVSSQRTGESTDVGYEEYVDEKDTGFEKEVEVKFEEGIKCDVHEKKVCKNNIQWQWQDSCGSLEEKIQECALGQECKSGECVCMPKCYAKFCGGNGCGGSCGSCLAGESCIEDTVCVASCNSTKEWEGTGFNSQIQWEWGCKVTKFLGVRKVGEDYLATVVGDGNFCGGQFVVKINSKGESVWIKHFYGKVIDVFGKAKGDYLVAVDQSLAIQDETEIVYLTELCTISEKNMNLMVCAGVDTNTTSKRKVNTVVQDGGKVLFGGTYENGIGSFAYVVLNEEKMLWVKTYNAGVKDEITSVAVHPAGYFLWGKKEGKDALKLVDTNGEMMWEKMYDMGFSGAGVVAMENGLYGVFGKDITHYMLLDGKGSVVQDVLLNVANDGTKKYLLQTPVDLAQLLTDGSFVAMGMQDNPSFGSWVAHFGVDGGMNGLTVEMNDMIQHMAVMVDGYMAVGTQWDGAQNKEWWMKRGWCGK